MWTREIDDGDGPIDVRWLDAVSHHKRLRASWESIVQYVFVFSFFCSYLFHNKLRIVRFVFFFFFCLSAVVQFVNIYIHIYIFVFLFHKHIYIYIYTAVIWPTVERGLLVVAVNWVIRDLLVCIQLLTPPRPLYVPPFLHSSYFRTWKGQFFASLPWPPRIVTTFGQKWVFETLGGFNIK